MPADFGTSSSSSYIYSVCANYIAADQQPQVTLIGYPYMYTARRYDLETGLYYYRARYYNPYIGRFTQLDPAHEGMNWYAYCGNNSINCTDPTGLYTYSINIPLSVIWDNGPTENWNNSQDNMVAVQHFLDNTQFGRCRGSSGTTLTGATYTGTYDSGYFTCTFESTSPSNPFSIGSKNGVPILLFHHNAELLDGRLADMVYGTHFFDSETLENINYSDWLATRESPGAWLAARAGPSLWSLEGIGELLSGYSEGMSDGIDMTIFHDPCTIAEWGNIGAISNVAGYVFEGSITAATGASIGTFIGGYLAGSSSSFIFYSGGAGSMGQLATQFAATGGGVTINSVFGNTLPYAFPAATSYAYGCLAWVSGAPCTLFLKAPSSSSYFVQYELPWIMNSPLIH